MQQFIDVKKIYSNKLIYTFLLNVYIYSLC